ncbi:helix-turn-helix transcriptional regulator, partial [Bacillus sp. B-TM1]
MKREWLIKLRKEKGFKQFEMAKTLDISSNYYCEIESGKKNPRWNIAMRIATFFDVTNYRRPDAEMICKLADIHGTSTDYIL